MLYLIPLLVIIVILLTMVWAGFSAAPWLPTFGRDLKLAVELAGIQAGETVYDLGCGDGRFLFSAAKQTHAGQLIGFEISLLPFFIAWTRKLFSPNSARVKIKFKNFYKADFTKVDVVYCFLMPRVMPKLERIIAPQMKPGARLVSYSFKLSGKAPEKVFKQNEKSLPIYLYRF